MAELPAPWQPYLNPTEPVMATAANAWHGAMGPVGGVLVPFERFKGVPQTMGKHGKTIRKPKIDGL